MSERFDEDAEFDEVVETGRDRFWIAVGIVLFAAVLFGIHAALK